MTREQMIDEAVRSHVSSVWTGHGLLIGCRCSYCLGKVKRIRAEFRRIRARERLNDAQAFFARETEASGCGLIFGRNSDFERFSEQVA